MNNLQIQDITTLFVILDDLLTFTKKGPGRPSMLTDSEMVTILMWSTLILNQKHIRGIYNCMKRYHSADFPKFPNYANFVAHCNRMIPFLWELLENTLDQDSLVQFVDSTMLPVCKLVRADRHKVAKGIASFGKNHQGWHYGFKLHATINDQGRLCGFYFTEASFYDTQALPHLIRGKVKVIIGDGTYNASLMRNKIWKKYGVFILAPPHPKQKKKLTSKWQHLLLKARPKIEAVFDYLKNHLNLVTSFPRSIPGYFLNYLRHLLAYQMLRGVS